MLRLIENIDGSVDVIKNKKIIDKILPEYNLEESLELLRDFNNVIIDNKKIYEKWKSEEYYILPALQEWIYWDYFVPIVKYRDLFKKYDLNRIDFKKSSFSYSNVGLAKYRRLVRKNPNIFLRIAKMIIIYILQIVHTSKDMLVFDDGLRGFRYSRIKKILPLHNVNYSRVHLLTLIDFFSIFKNKAFYYGYSFFFSKNIKISLKPFGSLALIDPWGFPKFLENLDIKCNSIINSVSYANKILKRNKIKVIYGYDQIEDILPLVIAAKKSSIKVITSQHGVLTKFQPGWLAPGIDKNFCNLKPDKLIVWGDFWKDNIIENSSKYLESDIFVGKHINKDMTLRKFEDNYQKDIIGKKNISLIYPFEFMANKIVVNKFLKKFLDSGCKITVKLRVASKNDPAGGDMKRDILSFDKDIREKINFIYELSDEEIINLYDIVLCTQSTFAFEMMKFNKPIWYLDTDFHMIDCIANKNLAHRITLENASTIVEKRNINSNFYKPLYDDSQYKSVFNQGIHDQTIIDQILL